MNKQVPLPNDTILVGKRGSYLITGLIGRGGFGVTYSADVMVGQPDLPPRVAVKEFFPRDFCERIEGSSELLISDAEKIEMVERLRDRFVKESRNLSVCDIDTVVKVFETIECNGTAYMIMELIDGLTLKEVMEKQDNRPFGLQKSRQLITKVADALIYLHEKKINHLDIKPSNLMVTEDLSRLVLIDFGMSRQYKADGSTDSEIVAAVSKGYASPEQYAGVHRFSPESDIYSLGATYYKLLTGQTPPEPFELDDNSSQLTFPAYVPESDRNAIRAAMETDRRKRIRSVELFKEMLKRKTTIDDAEAVELDMPGTWGQRVIKFIFNLLLLGCIGVAVFAAKVVVFDISGDMAYRFAFNNSIYKVSDTGFLACLGFGVITAIIGLVQPKTWVKFVMLVLSSALIFSQIYFAI